MRRKITPSMRSVLNTIQDYGAHTTTQLSNVTGYATGTVQVAVWRLQQLGKVQAIGKQYRGSGNGSGAPCVLYGVTDRS